MNQLVMDSAGVITAGENVSPYERQAINKQCGQTLSDKLEKTFVAILKSISRSTWRNLDA